MPLSSHVGARRSRAFVRSLPLPGWAASTWGYDAGLESFWAELRPAGAPGVAGVPAPPAPVRIGPDHLIATVPALAWAVARTARVPQPAAYAALTA